MTDRLQDSNLCAVVQRALGRKTLRFVGEHPGLTRSEIAERVHGHRKAVKRELDWLYSNGYVERHATPREETTVDGYYPPVCSTGDCDCGAVYEAAIYDGRSDKPQWYPYCSDCAFILRRGGDEIRRLGGWYQCMCAEGHPEICRCRDAEVVAAVGRMMAWAAANPQADTQGLMDDEWEALGRAALDLPQRQVDDD